MKLKFETFKNISELAVNLMYLHSVVGLILLKNHKNGVRKPKLIKFRGGYVDFTELEGLDTKTLTSLQNQTRFSNKETVFGFATSSSGRERTRRLKASIK